MPLSASASRSPGPTLSSPASLHAAGLRSSSPPRADSATAEPAYPRWCLPVRLRAWRLERGWRAELGRVRRGQKRTLDLALCLVAVLPATVAMALAAAAIWWESPGASPFYAQRRLGQHGREFRMWKLRTMVANADALEAELQHLNELPWPDFKIARDPRVTRVGRWLRRTSLDELPQIWNVMRGEMSWVGPRPTNFGVARYQLWHTERLAVPPGITGLWQVLERAQCDFDRRLRLDLAYVRAWRLGLDVAILARTLGAVWRGRGAW